MSKSDLRHRVAQAIDHAIDIVHAAGIEHGEAELLAQADAAIRVVIEDAVRVLGEKADQARVASDAKYHSGDESGAWVELIAMAETNGCKRLVRALLPEEEKP